jgi:hypothetical protein
MQMLNAEVAESAEEKTLNIFLGVLCVLCV